MRPIKYSPEIKRRARKLFVQGYNCKRISDQLMKEFKEEVPPVTILGWSRENKWMELYNEAEVKSKEKLVEKVSDTKATVSQQHLREYRKIKDKAITDLPELEFKSAEGAARAIDLAIQGERQVVGGVLSAELVQAIIRILLEEIEDQQLLQKIGGRMKEVVVSLEETAVIDMFNEE